MPRRAPTVTELRLLAEVNAYGPVKTPELSNPERTGYCSRRGWIEGRQVMIGGDCRFKQWTITAAGRELLEALLEDADA